MLANLSRFIRARRLSPVGFMMIVALGCSKQSASHSASTATDRKQGIMDTSSWLTVTDTPADVTRAINAAAKARAGQIAAIFGALGDSSYISSETTELLERDRSSSVKRLSAILKSDRITDKSVGASLLLWRMQEEKGRTCAGRILREGSASQRQRLINGLDGGLYVDSERLKHQAFLFADKELVEALLAQLEDSDEGVVNAAIQCCGILGVPGARARFIGMIQQSKITDKSRLLYWLSRGELTEALFDIAVEASKGVGPDDHWGATIFEEFAKSADESLRTKAKNRLREILKGWPDDGKQGYQGSRLSILSSISNAANEGDLDWLRELLNTESGLYGVEPLVASIRLSPKEGKELLVQWLDDDAKRRAAIDAASASFVGTADEEIVRALSTRASLAEGHELQAICTALNSVGGNAAQDVIEQYATKLDPASLSHIRQKHNQDSITSIAETVKSSGLLSAAEIEAAVARLTKEDGDYDSGLFGLLYAAKSAIAFDAETGILPCRHDSLILDFAAASRGRFDPKAGLEIWHRKDQEDFESPYTLQFVLDRTLYKAEIRNLGDWYDVERVVQMINVALSQSGIPERFVGLAAEGQIAVFVFVDPSLLPGVAKKFNMALSDDFESAMRQGLEFESHVRKQLEKPDE
jgi:hypothetical protein